MFAAKASTAQQRTASNAYSNIFLDTIIKMLARQSTNACDTFKEVMALYVKTSTETFLKVPRRWLSHANHAKECIAILNNHSNEDAMPEVITYLNTITTINPGGSFSLALSTYFAMFPAYLNHCSDELRATFSKLDLWENTILSWATHYMATHHRGNGSHEHETLEQLSTSIPDNMLDPYADFLMKQLHASNRHETRSGLYKGWVYAALGKLSPRLSTAKRETINKLLLAAFGSRHHDLSLIGLSEALCASVLPADKLTAIAEKLYLYVMRELSELDKMQEDHRSATESTYAEKAFVILKKLEAFLNPSMKTGLMTAMLSSEETFYKLRHNILVLENWVPTDKKLKMMEGLNIHGKFFDLAPLFWHWLAYDKNYGNKWARCNYSNHFKLANEDLSGIFTHFTPVSSYINLLIAENSTSQKQQEDIIENLINELVEHNNTGSGNMIRKEVHHALVCVKEWAEADNRFKIANIVQTSCHIKHADYNPDDVRVSAGLAASEYCELLSPEKAADLRDDLLELLDGAESVAKMAAHALENFKSRPNSLPALMTGLLTKPNNEHAQLLLTKLHTEYLQQDKVVNQKITLRV